MNAVQVPAPVPALDWLAADHRDRAAAGLRRTVVARRSTEDILDLASNDYLGLSKHPHVVAAAVHAVQEWGVGATGSRLVTGTTELHESFEAQIAAFLGAPAALCFSSGYLANIGAVTALAGPNTLIVSDGGAHASLIDACKLSRARVVVIPRGDVGAADNALATRSEQRAMVVTDSVYSIDGALAPIADLHAAARHHGAALVVDEAHGLGVRGVGGRGLVHEVGLAGEPDVVVTATMSKALGAQGGVVVASAAVRAHLIDRARSFIFDTGLAPAAVAGASAALRELAAQPTLPTQVLRRASELAAGIGADEPTSAVVSVIVGDPVAAVQARDACAALGVRLGCFRPPSVPAGTSRLRITARANLTDREVQHATSVIGRAIAERTT